MSIFQDKKLILHISLEIIIIGSMTYFFHTKSKSLELRVKSIEEQFSKEISILQDSITQLKKQLKKSEMSIEEIKYNKSVQQVSQNVKKNEKKQVEKTKDEFENILFNTFSISQPNIYKQHATVELIDEIVENKEKNLKKDKKNKEENKEENDDKNDKENDKDEDKDDEDENEENDNLSENGNVLDKELENELKELEN